MDNTIKEIYAFLGKIEIRTVNILKNLKKFFEINLLNNYSLIEKNIQKISKLYDKNFIFFSEELTSIRHVSNMEFQNIYKKIKFNNQAYVTDMENMIQRQVQLENIVMNRFKEIELIKKSIFKEVSNLESKVNVALKQEKVLRDCEHNTIKTELKSVSSSMDNTNEAIFSSLNKLISDNNQLNEYTKKNSKN